VRIRLGREPIVLPPPLDALVLKLIATRQGHAAIGDQQKETQPMSFGDHLQHAVTKALTAIPAADAPDIYAISFFIYDEDDDPQRPTLTVGYNTESQVKRVLDHATGRYPDPAEARWNYAYWLQNELTIIGDSSRDPAGAALRTQWIKDTPKFHEDHGQITTRFVKGCVRLTHSLQEVGLIERAIGHRVPVLIHELEYYEQIAKQTEAANPPRLADDFAAWVRDH
jgi:hypothetical protein